MCRSRRLPHIGTKGVLDQACFDGFAGRRLDSQSRNRPWESLGERVLGDKRSLVVLPIQANVLLEPSRNLAIETARTYKLVDSYLPLDATLHDLKGFWIPQNIYIVFMRNIIDHHCVVSRFATLFIEKLSSHSQSLPLLHCCPGDRWRKRPEQGPNFRASCARKSRKIFAPRTATTAPSLV